MVIIYLDVTSMQFDKWKGVLYIMEMFGQATLRQRCGELQLGSGTSSMVAKKKIKIFEGFTNNIIVLNGAISILAPDFQFHRGLPELQLMQGFWEVL